MNLFALEGDIATDRVDWLASARSHDDLRVSKMAVEACQILCTVANGFGRRPPYRLTHRNHPSTLWTGESLANYLDVIHFAEALLLEWAKRFERQASNHASWKVLAWCKQDLAQNADAYSFAKLAPTPLPMVMPQQFQGDSVIQSYRRFWQSKPRMVYRRTPPPSWFAST